MDVTDIRAILLKPLHGKFPDDLVQTVLKNPVYFEKLVALINDNDSKVSWRATWACEKICDYKPEWFFENQNYLIEKLMNSKHDGTKRLLLSILHHLPVPEPFPVTLLDYTFNHMFDLNEAIAVQSLCIKIAYKLCRKEPDLIPELKLYLENAEMDYYSPAVKSCIKNVMKKLH